MNYFVIRQSPNFQLLIGLHDLRYFDLSEKLLTHIIHYIPGQNVRIKLPEQEVVGAVDRYRLTYLRANAQFQMNLTIGSRMTRMYSRLVPFPGELPSMIEILSV